MQSNDKGHMGQRTSRSSERCAAHDRFCDVDRSGGLRLTGTGVEPSVASKGNNCVNGLADTSNVLSKAEVIHRRTLKSREAVESATLAWVKCFNNHRLMAPLGYITSALAEENYHC